MASKKFDCAECGNHGTISIKESEYISLKEISFCPLCGADIEKLEEDEELHNNDWE